MFQRNTVSCSGKVRSIEIRGSDPVSPVRFFSYLWPTGISWSPQSGLKGVRPPVEFEERPRDALQAMQEKKAFISR